MIRNILPLSSSVKKTNSSKATVIELEPIVLTKQELSFISTMSRLAEHWGFKTLTGRVWALLYLKESPLCPQQVQDAFSASAGNVNSVINELLHWGVLEKIKIPNDRKTYYKVDEQIWKSIVKILKSREVRLLEETSEELKNINFDKSNPNSKYQNKQVEHIDQTVQLILKFSKIALNAPLEKISGLNALINLIRKV